MISNFFLRVSWVFLVSVGTYSTSLDRRALVYLVAIGEIIRRFQWNFFRLENEHSNNCGQFRAVKEVPLPYAIMNNVAACKCQCDSSLFLICKAPTSPPDDNGDGPDSSEPWNEELPDKSVSPTTLNTIMQAMGAEQGRFYADREYDTKDNIERRKEEKTQSAQVSLHNSMQSLVGKSRKPDAEAAGIRESPSMRGAPRIYARQSSLGYSRLGSVVSGTGGDAYLLDDGMEMSPLSNDSAS